MQVLVCSAVYIQIPDIAAQCLIAAPTRLLWLAAAQQLHILLGSLPPASSFLQLVPACSPVNIDKDDKEAGGQKKGKKSAADKGSTDSGKKDSSKV